MQRETAQSLYPELGQFISGKRIQGAGVPVVVEDASTLVELGRCLPASDENIRDALAAAERGFEIWSRKSGHERCGILKKVVAIMQQRKEDLAAIVALEIGRPYADSLIEIDHSASMFDWAAEEARRSYGRIIPAREAYANQMVIREPLGPVAAFTAWNVPLTTPARKLSGALAAGCSVILKAAEEAPACSLLLGEICVEAGVPAEAVSVLVGNPERVSELLLASEIIRGLTFTGSTRVGKILTKQAVDKMIRPIMELGGHAPVLIFDDVDPEAVAKGAVAGKYKNCGQVCVSPTRFLVQRRIYERFLQAFVEHAAELTIGDAFDPDSKMGPLRNARRLAEVQALIADARTRGHRVFGGDSSEDLVGYFMTPAIIADADAATEAFNAEPFGPLAVMRPFDNIEEALSEANRLNLGLASYVMTNNLKIANRCAARIHAGNVIINSWRATLPETPFGGMRESGLGSEGGIEGIAAFQNTKFVYQG